MASRRRRVFPRAAVPRARSHGDRSPSSDVMALIAIAACRKLEDYKQSILHVGGDVRILDPSMSIDAALEGVDGLLLTGGDDVAPDRYGEPAHPTVLPAEEGRDAFEIGIIAAARKQ